MRHFSSQDHRTPERNHNDCQDHQQHIPFHCPQIRFRTVTFLHAQVHQFNEFCINLFILSRQICRIQFLRFQITIRIIRSCQFQDSCIQLPIAVKFRQDRIVSFSSLGEFECSAQFIHISFECLFLLVMQSCLLFDHSFIIIPDHCAQCTSTLRKSGHRLTDIPLCKTIPIQCFFILRRSNQKRSDSNDCSYRSNYRHFCESLCQSLLNTLLLLCCHISVPLVIYKKCHNLYFYVNCSTFCFPLQLYEGITFLMFSGLSLSLPTKPLSYVLTSYHNLFLCQYNSSKISPYLHGTVNT